MNRIIPMLVLFVPISIILDFFHDVFPNWLCRVLIYRCIFPLSFSGRLEFQINGKIYSKNPLYIQYTKCT